MVRSIFRREVLALALCAVALPMTTIGFYKESRPGEEMSQAATAFVGALDDEQRKEAVMPYESPSRLDWHFIPKDHRKGLQVRFMKEAQRKIAHQLLQTALSEAGYSKATKIMSLEGLLFQLEGDRRKMIRDGERYYFTVFGSPDKGRWGLSVEGHHLSLNFVIENGRVVSSTPQFYGANPGVVRSKNTLGFEDGFRVLAKEETLAFDLVKALSVEQKKVAITDDKAPKDIRNAATAQPPTDPAIGLAAGLLMPEQQKVLRSLIEEYANAMPEQVAQERLKAIDEAGFAKVQFAWQGALEPGIGHAYRIQGPTFLIEFNNTQPDGEGNPANHVHSVWRDMAGDFGLPIGGK